LVSKILDTLYFVKSNKKFPLILHNNIQYNYVFIEENIQYNQVLNFTVEEKYNVYFKLQSCTDFYVIYRWLLDDISYSPPS